MNDLLEIAWAGLAGGTLELHRLRAANEYLFALYMLGFDAGVAAQAERVRQAEHDADRAWLRVMNGDERGAVIGHRLDRAIASCPPDVDPHSVGYFEHALRGVLTGSTA